MSRSNASLVPSNAAERHLVTDATPEEELAFLTAAVASSEDAIITENLAGIVTGWSSGACQMYGYLKTEVVGRPISLIVAPDHRDKHRNIMVRLRRSARLTRLETVHVRKGGGQFVALVTISPVKNTRLRLIGATTVAREITDRKLAEEEHARLKDVGAARAKAETSESRFRLLAEASALLAASFDVEAALKRVALSVVTDAADWFAIDVIDENGRTRRVGSAHVDGVTPVLLHALERHRRPGAGIASGVALVLDGAPNMHRSLHLRELRDAGLTSLMKVPLQSRGHDLGILTFAMGPSGRHFGDDDLVCSQDLALRCALALENSRLYSAAQRAIVVRDEFLAATSHELRTPLGHVKGFVSTLRRADMNLDEATRADFLTEVEREADRLAELIADLLEWSRVASGELTVRRLKRTSLTTLVSAGLDRARGVLVDRVVSVDVSPGLPRLLVDASQMERVVANLVENAAKYTPSGTPIHILGSAVGGSLILRVEDEGLGIRRRHLEQVFEPFFRESRLGSPSKPGTGLGLALCRSIVRAHGGQIRAENRPSGGAAFVITLPAA